MKRFIGFVLLFPLSFAGAFKRTIKYVIVRLDGYGKVSIDMSFDTLKEAQARLKALPKSYVKLLHIKIVKVKF